MTAKFVREERYTVLKISDVSEALDADEAETLIFLEEKVAAWRRNNGKPPLQCVVVENDWPEYEPTWQAIERRVSDQTPAPVADADPLTDKYLANLRSRHPQVTMVVTDSLLAPTSAEVAEVVEALEVKAKARARFADISGLHRHQKEADLLRKAITLIQRPAVPDGWKPAPIIPTVDMVMALRKEVLHTFGLLFKKLRIDPLLADEFYEAIERGYSAMLAAAPKPGE